jgi:cold shock CspA family protein
VSLYLQGAARKAPPFARHAGTPPIDPRGTAATGRIMKLLVGQCHGFIRLANSREVFFHRTDLREGTSINDFVVGDAVTFELVEDAVSGARAQRVRRCRRR